MRTPLLTTVVAVIAASALSACGSSSSSSSSGTSASSTATSSSPATHSGSPLAKAVPVHTPSATRHIPGVAGRRAGGVPLAALEIPRQAAARPHVAGLSGLSLEQKLAVLFNDVTPFWQQVFHVSKLALPPLDLQLVGATPFSCGSTRLSSTSAPAYCSGSPASIILPLGTMQGVVEPLGDSALLLLESDFYAEHVATALGYTSQKGLSDARLEKLYVCLSGRYFAWAQGATVQGRPLITGTDEQGVNNLITAQGRGAASGLSAQDLTNAFNTGANGSLKACLSGA